MYHNILTYLIYSFNTVN